MSMLTNIRASSIAMAMLTGWVVLASAARAAETEAEKVSRILSDAKMQAYQLKVDADNLEAYSRSNATWESHADAINRIKDDVNTMGRTLAKLEENRTSAEPWQRTAIDRIMPVAKELAANTTAATEQLAKFPRRLNTPTYQDYLEAICDSATNLASTITDFVDYDKTRQRLARLSGKVEVESGGQEGK